jgi:hypothetical protein
MDIYRFAEVFAEEIIKDLPNFLKNMETLGIDKEDKPFCEWSGLYLSWAEFMAKEDCERYYGHKR